jgi:hypothetical protein
MATLPRNSSLQYKKNLRKMFELLRVGKALSLKLHRIRKKSICLTIALHAKSTLHLVVSKVSLMPA